MGISSRNGDQVERMTPLESCREDSCPTTHVNFGRSSEYPLKGQKVDQSTRRTRTRTGVTPSHIGRKRPTTKEEGFDEPLTLTGVFKILKVNLSEDDLAELLEDFTDDRLGVEELVFLTVSDISILFETYKYLKAFKAVILKFCRWYNEQDHADGDSLPPQLTPKTWNDYLNGNPTAGDVKGGVRGTLSARKPCHKKSESLLTSTLEVIGTGDEVSVMTGPLLWSSAMDAENILVASSGHQDLANAPVAFPGASRVQRLLDRYNRNVGEWLPSISVNWVDVEKMYKHLKVVCPRGLVDSLVYAKRDLSVFVRNYDPFGYIVDIALCNQDRTHRSNVSLDGDLANYCDNRVGEIGARMRAPDVSSLHPIVRHFVKKRVVETIKCPIDNLCTIELAPSYNPNRIEVPTGVPASDLWGYHGHDRLKFDFDRSIEEENLFAAWLICMTLFERKTTETEQEAIRGFIMDRYTDFEDRRMTKNVNYETMFRSKGPEYRSGRLSWPLILGLCMAKNLKEEFRPFEPVNDKLRSQLGSYRGMFTRKHVLCGGISIGLVVVVFVVVGMAISEWEVEILLLFTPSLLVFAILFIVTINFYFFQDVRPWAFLIPDGRSVPRLFSENRELAVRLLFSKSCRTSFDGTNLSFTGETYSGTSTFGYQFTYEDLRELGFRFYCDSWGQEHLRVPKTKVLVRMERTRGAVDKFVRVRERHEPQLLFEKPWYSTTTYPG